MNNKKEYKRNCPKCNIEIKYKYYYDGLYADKNKTRCKKCSANDPQRITHFQKRFSGKNNPFFGKHHTEETKKKISSKTKGRKLSGKQLENSRKNMKKANELRGNRNFYSFWLEKYGKEIADIKMKQFKDKQSKLNSGENNNMYGKPSPKGSGNGWACWYKNIHFRSLRELMYFIFEIENKGLKSRSAQSHDLTIKYINWDGKERTYRADFFVEEKYLIEVKPKKLWNCKEVQAKKIAAEKWCEKNGYEYKLVDIEPNSELLKEKYLNGEIRFVNKYVDRFKKYIGNV